MIQKTETEMTVEKDYYQELSENVNLFFDVYREINMRYVDSVDNEKFIKTGIKSMLSSLDPYTVLLDEESKEHFDELSSGKYGGIGIYMGISGADKRLTVESPIDNTPASKVGLRGGDKIMEIDGKSTDGLSISDASPLLRGEAGTRVYLKVKRVGVKKFLDFEIVRERITIINVPYSGLVDGNIGYIKVSQFAKTTVEEVKKCVLELLNEGAEGFILDLRYNPGGLLSSAVDVSNLFLDANSEIVVTKGRDDEIISSYCTQDTPIAKDVPLVVLINGASASASEIVSGSLQDYDRAVVVGQNSYGKGLVQQIYKLGENNSVKITVAKYYTPSGRLIQKRDYFNDKDDTAMTDTLLYYTENGRKVQSGMGIIPDVKVETEKLSDYLSALRMKNIFSDFTYSYLEENSDFDYQNEITEDIIQDFKTYIDTVGFEYTIKGELETDSLLAYVSRNGYSDSLKEKIKILQTALENEKKNDFRENLTGIKKYLNIEFSVYKYGNPQKYEISIADDKQIVSL